MTTSSRLEPLGYVGLQEEEAARAPSSYVQGGRDRDSIRDLPFADDIPWTTATGAYGGTSHDPDRRGATVIREYSEHMQARQAKLTAEDFEEYRKGYRSHYLSWLGALASTVSTLIAGRSNFNVDRAQKKSNAADRRYEELQEWSRAFMGRVQKREEVAALAARGGVIGDLEQRIAARTAEQEKWKQINKIAKSRGAPEEKVEKYKALGLSEKTAQALLKPDDYGDFGIPAWQLTNNLKEIRRLEGRLVEEQAKEARSAQAQAVGGQDFEQGLPGGITVTYNTEEDRIQLAFPGKPASETIGQLKGAGFRWSPSNGVWQRQLTDNAVWAVRRMLNVELPALADAAAAAVRHDTEDGGEE